MLQVVQRNEVGDVNDTRRLMSRSISTRWVPQRSTKYLRFWRCRWCILFKTEEQNILEWPAAMPLLMGVLSSAGDWCPDQPLPGRRHRYIPNVCAFGVADSLKLKGKDNSCRWESTRWFHIQINSPRCCVFMLTVSPIELKPPRFTVNQIWNSRYLLGYSVVHSTTELAISYT